MKILEKISSLGNVNGRHHNSLTSFKYFMRDVPESYNQFLLSNPMSSFKASNLILDAFTIQKQARNHILETLILI